MRNQWRHLLRHRFSLSSPVPLVKVLPNPNPNLNPDFRNFPPLLRYFSSEISPKNSMLIDIFTDRCNNDEISKEIEVNNLVVDHDVVLDALDSLKLNPNVGIKFFKWVLEKKSEKLSSKSYNMMLKMYGVNGFVDEFWNMVGEMKCKGYGVSKGTFIEVSSKFEKDGLVDDLERLKGLFSRDPTVEAAGARVARIVKNKVWDESVEKELSGLGVEYSSELVKVVLDKLSLEPMKAVIFFRWVEESGLARQDEKTYNALVLVLGREDCRDRFWSVVDQMRNEGYGLEIETYVKVLDRFVKRRMLNDAVSLYEFAMNGANKPSMYDCTFLLKKIVVSKELDLELFSRVVKTFTEKGFALEDSMLDGVLKSLTSVGRMKECNKIVGAMVECGYRPNKAMQNRVAFDLSSSKMKDESNEFMQNLQSYGMTPDQLTWASLIEGHCVAGDLEKAIDSFHKMVESEGPSFTAHPLDLIVSAHCNREKSAEAFKFLTDITSEKEVKPWHDTYKTLIRKLLVQKCFNDALTLLKVMKNHGFPPFLDPFVAYLSKRGTADEAMLFFKAMTVQKFPSTNVFVRVFEAFSKSGRHREAQNLLAKCPKYIRNQPDVLGVFYSMKSEKTVKPAAVAA